MKALKVIVVLIQWSISTGNSFRVGDAMMCWRFRRKGGWRSGPTDYLSTVVSVHAPNTYFGNCVGGAIAIASRVELATAGAGGLLTARTAAVEEAARGMFVMGVGNLWRRPG
ncbi:hypothetical protein PR202_ga24677 [Eleusine coracana subsp. coracana]|uniref:Secreted protein n=1 Tax=Eleusine coracana subsp. coracana TaxID=191504 RepID=A0AAV5D8Y8_ELECO|nr:hypothetical protein PR202_ga24677 [Eleusine coracana subsp. coracana]